jgi:hypothetical protein
LLQAPPGRCDALDGRSLDERSVGFDEDRQSRVDQPETLEQVVGLGRARLVPLVRLRAPREEVAKAVVLAVHPLTHDLDLWAHGTHVVDGNAALHP